MGKEKEGIPDTLIKETETNPREPVLTKVEMICDRCGMTFMHNFLLYRKRRRDGLAYCPNPKCKAANVIHLLQASD